MPRRDFVLLVTGAEHAGTFRLRIEFNDDTRKTVDVFPLLDGPIFAPLRDPLYFALGRLDPQAATVTWPNGADFAPEALWELPDVGEDDAAAQASPSPADQGLRQRAGDAGRR